MIKSFVDSLMFWRKAENTVKGSHRQLGAKGEKLARKFLKNSGLKILGRNYKTPFGEVDIVALDGSTIVFCEVKTRSSDNIDPQSAIDFTRRKRYRNVAKHYLGKKRRGDLQVRFDVIFVIITPDSKPDIRHVQSAF